MLGAGPCRQDGDNCKQKIGVDVKVQDPFLGTVFLSLWMMRLERHPPFPVIENQRTPMAMDKINQYLLPVEPDGALIQNIDPEGSFEPMHLKFVVIVNFKLI